MTCPFRCGITFDRKQALVDSHTITASVGAALWRVDAFECPSCHQVAIELTKLGIRSTNEPNVAMARLDEQVLLWPRSGRVAPPEVPADLARDYAEAAAVLADSTRASAALSRRCLQHILRDHHQAKGPNLAAEIDSVIDRFPSHISESLHALRQLGNFAAHPIKVEDTGQVVDVEPGEAEWTIETIEALFDYTFVAPARHRERIATMNQKLKATGKPPLPHSD